MPTFKTLTDAKVRGLKHADGEAIDAKSGVIARADKTGAITFSFRYRNGAARRRITLGRYPAMSLADARAAAGRVRERVRIGNDPQADRRNQREATSELTFNALADSYLERYAKLQKSSWKHDEWFLRHARRVWGKRGAASITRQDAAKLLFDVVVKAPVKANRLRSILMKLFNWSIDAALLDANPILGVKKPHREGRGKDRVLNDREIRVLWRALDQTSAEPGTVAALRTLLLLGQRPGEVSGLAIGELHLDDARAAFWELPASRTKTRRIHTVPLPSLARSIIMEELERPRAAGSEAVFAARRPRLAPQALSAALARLINNLDGNGGDADAVASLKADRPTPHDLRRTVATGLSKLGIPRDDRLAVLAHSYGDVHEIYDQYERLPQKRAALEMWERHLRKVIADQPQTDGRVLPRKQEFPSSELESAQEPTKKQVLEKWSKVLKEDKPTTFQLLITCYELLDSPHLIQGPLAPYIYLILQSWRAKTRVPKRGNSGKEVANLVDSFHRPGVRLTAARKRVAELLGRTVEAVTQSDLRHRKARRDEPR